MGICARVIGNLGNQYLLESEEGDVIEAGIRGNMKKKGTIFVGDWVEFEKVAKNRMITKVIERKNFLIRPPVSNLDQLIIVLSMDQPKPDYMLLDKEIVLCLAKNIVPIICMNKIDLEDRSQMAYVNCVYANLGIQMIRYKYKKWRWNR